MRLSPHKKKAYSIEWHCSKCNAPLVPPTVFIICDLIFPEIALGTIAFCISVLLIPALQAMIHSVKNLLYFGFVVFFKYTVPGFFALCFKWQDAKKEVKTRQPLIRWYYENRLSAKATLLNFGFAI